MAYELRFSPEFFLAEGEPYDRSDLALDDKGHPLSVWSAIQKQQDEDPEWWANMAREIFDLPLRDAGLLMVEGVLDKIRETNTCRNLDSPVEVYIDPEGHYTVRVWDV